MKKYLKRIVTMMLVGALAGCAPNNVGSNIGEGKEDPVVLTCMMESSDGWVRNFNPYSTGVYQVTQGFMYEPLVIFDTLNKNQETMWLAEDIISEPDNKTLTIKVRKDVKWSDGETFDATDVAFNFTYPRDYPEIDRNGNWGEDGKISEVKIIDDHTVQIVMKEANRFHRNSLFYQVNMAPEHIFSKIDNPASHVLEEPVVTGSFSVVKSFTSEMIALGRNPYYWKADDLKVDEIRVPQFNGNDGGLALLQSGTVDWAYMFIPNIDSAYVQGDEHREYWYGINDGVRLSFNYMTENEGNKTAFNNVDFKRALSMAVDRKGIIDSAVFGYLSDEVPPNTGIPSALWEYKNEEAQAEMAKYTKYDIEGAKALLDKAGFKDIDGDGYVENPDGSKIAFDILSPAGWTDWNDGAEICAEGFRKIGVNGAAKAVDLSLIIETWESGKHDMLYTAYGLATNVWKFYYDTIGDTSRVKTPTWWSICQTNYVNEEMSSLIQKLPTASDQEVTEITAEVENFFAENMINIPVLYNGSWNVYNTSRFTGWATEDNPVFQPANCMHDTKILQLHALEPVK